MKIIVEGNLISIYKNPDFKDKETGEITAGKHKLELLVDSELSNGNIRHEMQEISIPDEKVSEYKAQIGKKVQVKCDFISKSNVSFFVR